MDTLTFEQEENEHVTVPLFQSVAPDDHDDVSSQPELLNSNSQSRHDLLDVTKETEGTTEILFNTSKFKSDTISFFNINYTIGETSCKSKRWIPHSVELFPFFAAKPEKQILTNISGIFTPGMNAVLGPTGCGKSTLLDILADRKHRVGLSGKVLVSGKPRPSYFKYTIGYVVQDDVISGTLTVRENLLFSANVRLPRSITYRERIDRVNQIISDLDLQACADTFMGTDFVRGVSGGEKKRTRIGMELVLSPNLLFLDEPTTGLDASTAQNVMLCLHKLSRQGRTIIFSIHQPRYSIFKLFDTIMVLAGGHNIYLGPSVSVLPYFASQGFNCEEHDNPADFILDVLIKSNNDINMKLRTNYLKSQMYSTISEMMRNETNKNLSNKSNDPIKDDKFHKDYSNEFYYVTKRTLHNVLRNPVLVASQIISVIIYGIFTGFIFNKLEIALEPGVRNRFGVIFFIISCQVLTSVGALEPLIKERALFIHENVSGYYRVSSFYLAKLIIDLPLVHLIPSIIYAVITFFMIGIRRSSQHFLLYFITNIISKIFGSAMCYFISACTATFGVALVMIITIYVTMMLFSGFLIDLASISTFLRWIQWLSVFNYASNVLAISEFRNTTFCASVFVNEYCQSGEDILTRRHISYETTWDISKNILALLLISTIFFILAYVQLLRMKKFK